MNMTEENDDLLDAIVDIIPRLLGAMDAMEQVQRNMHPPWLAQFSGFVGPVEERLKESSTGFLNMNVPEHLSAFKQQMDQGINYALKACDGILHPGEGMGQVMKAMRASCRAQEFIYPISSIMKPVNQYYLEAEVRQDEALIQALSEGAGKENVGIMNANNERDQRGGFSLYVPENSEAGQTMPLVTVLHGGTGHGADFLWSWLREARSRGFMVLAPTSRMDTWSLMGEDYDLPNLMKILDYVRENWSLDEDHMMLTGMSDGGTYSLLAGLREDSPFTHLAPFSGVLHPEISMTGNMSQAQDKAIYLVHGVLDWMFPVETAQMAAEELKQAGADLTYREIDNLSHAYARSENPDLLAWFNPALKV